MNTTLKKVLLPILSLAFISCSDNATTEVQIAPKALKLSANQTEMLQKGNDFGLNLYKNLVFENLSITDDSNVMISPLSASVALTMVLNGSNAETKTQIQNMLGFESSESLEEINANYKASIDALLNADDKVQFGLANAAFYRNDFSITDNYVQILKTNFDADVNGLDFANSSAVTAINDWAANHTNQKITQVMDKISNEAVLFLLNALYFKGDWTYKFDESKTEYKPFGLLDGSSAEVPTMISSVQAMRTSTDYMYVVELPYGQGNYSMTLMLPKESISDIYANLDADSFRLITAELDSQTEWESVIVDLPKFKFSYSQILNATLQSLGMQDAFDPIKADLSPINPLANLYISFVKQDTFIEVNEKGTEAAAVTQVGIEVTSVGGGVPRYTFDKPFMFVIRERTTNTILFVGSVLNPLKEN